MQPAYLIMASLKPNEVLQYYIETLHPAGSPILQAGWDIICMYYLQMQ